MFDGNVIFTINKTKQMGEIFTSWVRLFEIWFTAKTKMLDLECLEKIFLAG